MKTIFTRYVALFLLPCLLSDPALAFSQPQRTRYAPAPCRLFKQDALIARVVFSPLAPFSQRRRTHIITPVAEAHYWWNSRPSWRVYRLVFLAQAIDWIPSGLLKLPKVYVEYTTFGLYIPHYTIHPMFHIVNVIHTRSTFGLPNSWVIVFGIVVGGFLVWGAHELEKSAEASGVPRYFYSFAAASILSHALSRTVYGGAVDLFAFTGPHAQVVGLFPPPFAVADAYGWLAILIMARSQLQKSFPSLSSKPRPVATSPFKVGDDAEERTVLTRAA